MPPASTEMRAGWPARRDRSTPARSAPGRRRRRARQHPHHVGADVERQPPSLSRGSSRAEANAAVSNGNVSVIVTSVTRSCSTVKNDGPPDSTTAAAGRSDQVHRLDVDGGFGSLHAGRVARDLARLVEEERVRHARRRGRHLVAREVRDRDAGGEVLPDAVAGAGVEDEPALDRVVDVGRAGLEVALELEPIGEVVGRGLEGRR